MKSLVHSLSFFSLTLCLIFIDYPVAVAQEEYVSMPTENAVWIQQRTWGLVSNPIITTTSLGISGDTTINEQLYHKIYESNDSIWSIDNSDISYKGCFREDSMMVYFVPWWYESDKEEKIMDFTVEVGDTISYLEIIKVAEEYYTAYVSEIDSIILLNGETRKRIKIDYSERIIYFLSNPLDTSIFITKNYDVWIEGIGRVPWYESVGTLGGYELLCYYEDDVQLYNNETIDYCFLSTSIEELEKEKDFVTVFPNPCVNVFTIEFQKKYFNIEVSIFDLSGSTQQQREYQNKQIIEFDINNELLQGIYIIVVKADDDTFTTKILRLF